MTLAALVTPPPTTASAPRRPVPVASTDERVRALLASQGPRTVAQLCEALCLGQVSGTMSLDRLRLAGAVQASAAKAGNADVWETTTPG